ncbi:hypothetical protein [Enhydrobacter sp.]|uniref:WD40 repeat domain-containing protein n=1 Tax=Enhydrobacter sp. TaxID=1894999 RepID=UPI0026026D2F|nr:hypothetical protein [Enhydrobacter sp.]
MFAVLASVSSAGAQASLPVFDPASIAFLSFRPGDTDMLLLARSDEDRRLEVHLVRASAGGRVALARTLPGHFTSVAWLDKTHLVTGGDDGRLESWPLYGREPNLLATFAEPIGGIGVAPASRNLALRLSGTLRLLAPDGRPNGPTITLGQPPAAGEICPPDDIERAPSFSADEQLLAFAGVCGDLRVVGPGGVRLMQPDIQRPYVRRHVFSDDGQALGVVYPAPDGVDILPVVSGRLGSPHAVDANDEPLDLAALPGRRGFVALFADRMRFLDPDGGLRQDDAAPAGSRRIAASADGSRIAVAAAEGLVLLDGDGRRLERPFGDFGLPVAARAIAGGTQIAALHADGRLQVWRLDGSESRDALRLWKNEPSGAGSAIAAAPPRLFVSPGGRKVGVLAPDGQFEVFDQAWNRIGRPMRFPAGPKDTALAATLLLDDRLLRPMPDGSGFLMLDLDGRVLGRMAFGDQQKLVPEAAVASAGVIAIYTADGRLAAWSRDGRPIRQRKLAASGLSAPSLDISADGKTIVLHDAPANLPPHLLVWKLGSDDSLESRDGRFAGLLADGSLLRVSGPPRARRARRHAAAQPAVRRRARRRPDPGRQDGAGRQRPQRARPDDQPERALSVDPKAGQSIGRRSSPGRAGRRSAGS